VVETFSIPKKGQRERNYFFFFSSSSSPSPFLLLLLLIIIDGYTALCWALFVSSVW
jgi:hypothetical protein